ncbi:EF-hand calcium-binding domain-containing protein 7-like isoform X2 [Lineus longissimus]|uniref:EF-hand calcium-binding domain-containing protein 7-like isoform X2 n=1 Tax=Lineus longissimus TaxID=88925 RepID=UPI00315DBD13
MSRRNSGRQSLLGIGKDEDMYLDCKAVYLSVYDDMHDKIKSKSQLNTLLQQAGRNPSQKSLAKHWPNGTSTMTFDDFVECCKKEPVTSEDDLLKAFRQIDTNGDGYLSHSELYKVMTSKGEKMTREEVSDMIDEVDENKDGKLDYKEFCQLVLSTSSEVKKVARQRLEKKEKSSKKSSSVDSPRSSSSRSPRVEEPSPRSRRLSKPIKVPTGGSTHVMNGYKLDDHNDDDDIIMGKDPRRIIMSNVENGLDRASDSPTPKPRGQLTKTGTTDKDKGAEGTAVPRPRPRSAKGTDRTPAEHPKPQPRSRSKADDRPKSPVASKKVKLPEPKTLKQWKHLRSQGCLHLDEDGKVISHKFDLILKEDTNIWMIVKPTPIKTTSEMSKAPIDVGLMLIDSHGKLVSLTEQRDSKGVYCLRGDIGKGVYTLLPFSTGCRLKKRTTNPKVESKLIKKEGEKYVLTKGFKEALNEVFDQCDLDRNGTLSREEFNLYNLRTSGEEVADEEWEVAEENIDLIKGEITKKGFIQLNQMEADDNEGDTDDLWVTLSSMGYNKGLVQDEACSFMMDLYLEDAESARLNIMGYSSASEVEQAFTEAAISKGESNRVCKDIDFYTYVTDFRATYVLQNKSNLKNSVKIDSSKSRNVNSNLKDNELVATVDIPTRSSVVALHLLPTNERQDWTIRCEPSL